MLSSFIIKFLRKILCFFTHQLEYLYYRLLYKRPKIYPSFKKKRYLFINGNDFDEISKIYSLLFPNKIKNKIAEAELICEHIFDILNSGPKRVSPKGKIYQQIDWHCDFKSGYRWNSKKFYRNIRYGHKEGVDIKVPWELSRFQHLIILGQAYVLTKNKKYAIEFSNQISDWIKNNPVGFGVNWKCAMEVAIRSINWLIAQEYFLEEGLIDNNFWQDFYTSIYEHGKFIWKNLENKSNFKNNHYISNLLGLFFIAIYCPFFKESKKWREFAIRELNNEIEKQVYPDGCNFEASTSYHRLVLEMFFYAELLGDRSGFKFQKKYKDIVRKMFEFSLYCIKPNGNVPQIGDNDNGRLIIFCKRQALEHKYLLNIATIHYKCPDFKVPDFNFDEESFWIFGIHGKKIFDSIPFRKEPIGSKEFPHAGWYIIRHNNNYCFISCGPNGQNEKGGHAHNDKLSFELMLNGQDVIVDPGTYVYTSQPNERNKFRSTGYHNTIKFNEYEQNKLSKRDIFYLPEELEIKKTSLKKSNNFVVFQGVIRYFGIQQIRKITFNSNSCKFSVQDDFCSLNTVKGKIIFHLSPIVSSKNNDIITRKKKKKIASIKVLGGHRIEKGAYDYSPEYGVKIKADSLILNIIASKDVKTVTTYIYKK